CGHGFADDAEGFLAHLVIRHKIIGLVVPYPLDRICGHELLYVDRARAFEADSFQLLILEGHIVAFGRLIALYLVLFAKRLAGFGIHIAASDAMARCTIDGMEADLLASRGCRC